MAASAVIGALRVNLGIDSAQFSSGLKEAQAGAERFSVAAKAAFVAVAAAAVAAAAAFAVGIKETIDSTDDLSKAAVKIGIPIEALSQLRYAADLSGVSMEGLEGSVGKLSRAMNDAKNGSKNAVAAFKQIGVSATNTDGTLKSPMKVLSELSDVFSHMPDGAQKTAIAMKLLGKSGADMIPLLNGGSNALHAAMDEANSFGLTISKSTGQAAEAFNDNLSRIGYAVQGVKITLMAALLPALVVVSDAAVAMAKGFVAALDYLPTLASDAAVAAGALALMAAPAIIGGIVELIALIGTQLVAAIGLVTAAIAANPLGAIAVGIAIAVTAIYHFRDEIQKAIGVDVVGIAKTAGNLIIGSFVATFHDIQFLWKTFPDLIEAAVVGAVNAVISGVNSMVDKVKQGVNTAIGYVNMIPGVAVEPLDPTGGTGIEPLANPAADRVSKANTEEVGRAQADMSTDYIGKLSSAFSGSTPAVVDYGNAVAGVNDELDALGGGGKAGKKVDPWEGLRKVSPAAKAAADALKRMSAAMQQARESLGEGFGNIMQGLIDKSLTWKDALVQAGQALLKYLNQMNVAQGGQGLFGGGFLQGLFSSLLGFANGGTIMTGGTGGIDSQVVAFRKSPTEQVDVYDPRKGGGNGGGGSGQSLGVHVVPSPYFDVHVEKISGRIAQDTTAKGLTAYDKGQQRRQLTTG